MKPTELIGIAFWALLILSALAPIAPWGFAYWRGARSALMSTAKALSVLVLLSFLLLPACSLADCREGTMVVFALWYAVAISVGVTIVSAAIAAAVAAYVWHR